MSLFPISKRLTFFGLFRICSFQGTCSLRSHVDRTAFGWRLANSGSASQTPRRMFTTERFLYFTKDLWALKYDLKPYGLKWTRTTDLTLIRRAL